MTANSATLRGRAAAERLMVDTCLIRRRTGQTTDPELGTVAATYTTVYAGKCRVQQTVPVSKPADIGQAAEWLARLVLQLPMSVTGLQSDDLVTITTTALDPDLLGRTWHVRDLGHATHKTARRLQIEEVTS